MGKIKKIKFMMIVGLIFIVTTASTCSKDDDSPRSNSSSELVAIATNGTWKISYYYDSDQDETATFTGYNFTFATNNVLSATKGSTTYTGIWSITDSNSNDDSLSDLDFNIAFTSPSQFLELNDDWEIIEKSTTVIKLKDVSGGNGGADYLTFTKN